MQPTRLFLTLTLGFWLGIYALRSYVPAAVWNLADELPLGLKPVLAVATHALGVLGLLLIVKWRRRTLNPLALAFCAVMFARQAFVASDQIGPWLSLLSWVLWLCFMAALADEVAAHDAEALIAPACALALAFQLGMQSAWHGLELPSVRGPAALLLTGLLVLTLAASVVTLRPAELPRPHASLAWLLLGPALFLEVTYAGNVGRFSEMTSLALPAATLVLQITLLLAVLIAWRATQFAVRMLLVTAGFAALFLVPPLAGAAALIVLTVQPIIIAGLREAADRRIRVSGATAFTAGAALHFILIFAFYNAYELSALWLVAFAALVVTAILPRRQGGWPVAMTTPLFALAGMLALLYFLPPSAERVVDEPATLTVATYNIHHGFDYAGTPGMQQIATEIANMNPHLLALQEIGRGWTVVGGNDLVAYLQWRFPHYRVYFAATNGQLWGNAIMSRLPVSATAAAAFTAEPGVLRYGWIGAVVDYQGLRFPFYSVHLTAEPSGPSGDPRTVQAEELLESIGAQAHVLVGGDFNAHPQDAPIRYMTDALRDLGTSAGLGMINTWPAGRPNERIDYIFSRGFRARTGAIPSLLASDHLPVLLQVQPERE